MPHEIPLWHFNQTLIPKSHLNWEFMKIYYKTKVIWLSILQNHFQSFLIKVQWSQGECQIHDFLLRVIPSIGIWHYCVHPKICIKYRKHGWIIYFYSILTSKSFLFFMFTYFFKWTLQCAKSLLLYKEERNKGTVDRPFNVCTSNISSKHFMFLWIS